GSATIAYEGALDHPDTETFYRIIERNGVTGAFTSPTAVRLLMRYGNAPARAHDLSSLERVFCAGEVLNAPAWEWFQKEALQDKVPVIDHYWQTETGGPVVGNPYGLASLPIRPGSGGVPVARIGEAGDDAGVTGRPDELRGQVISAFVVLKQGHTPSEELKKALIATVRTELGPLAVIGELNFVDMLPKTRSGKIMRRVLRAVILDKDPGDISTIEDEGSVEDAREAWSAMKQEVAKT